MFKLVLISIHFVHANPVMIDSIVAFYSETYDMMIVKYNIYAFIHVH